MQTPSSVLLAVALTLCLGSTTAATAVTQKSPVKSAGTAPLPLPISLLDLMRASIEIPADGIWATQSADMLSDEEWQLVDQDAVNLIQATTWVASGGTGKHDQKWTANPDWQAWVRDMEKTALDIRAVAMTKQLKPLRDLGDHLQEICSACHAKYRPEAPSDGVARYPFYPRRELTK